jgi:outer membrane protein TolC
MSRRMRRPTFRPPGGIVLAAALLALTPPARLRAQGAPAGPVTLQQAIDLAQRQSFPARMAERSRSAARERDRAFGAALLPQISLTGDVPVYNRSIIPVLQPDGSTLFRAQQQNTSTLGLRVDQQLPFTGTSLFVSSTLQRLQRSGQQDVLSYSSTPFSVGLTQNLLRSNDQSWRVKLQDLSITVAERQYLEAREDVAINTAIRFFDFYAARTSLANAGSNAAVNDTLYTLNKGRYEVGKIGENDLLQSELALLRSRNSLDAARLEFDRAQSALRLQLNLPPGTPLEIAVDAEIPPVTADTAIAVAQALRNRANVTQQELQGVQARQQLSQARLNTGFGAQLRASVGYNQVAEDVNAAYRDLLSAQNFSVSVSMPIVTWGGRGAQIEAAKADQERAEFGKRQVREQLAQDAHFAALQVDLARSQLALSAKADTVANKRFEVAKNRYVIGKIGIDNLYLAQNEKDQALQSYVGALRGFWNAYYQLRRTTLYDFVTASPLR